MAAVDVDHDGFFDVVETDGWWEDYSGLPREWMGERSLVIYKKMVVTPLNLR